MSLEPYFESIMDFFTLSGVDVKPYPSIKTIDSNDDSVFAPTGSYNADNKEITLYIGNRHPKDVLRSFAHELFHHHQFLSNGYDFDFSGSLESNPELETLESEAYLNGNILFRRWTELFTK